MLNAITAGLMIIYSLNVLADISIIDGRDDLKTIMISGKITPSDFNTLIEKEKEILSVGKLDQTVLLDSPGGDLTTAIKIGRYFRKSKKYYRFVMVPSGSVCASSCVLILAAGIHKLPLDGSSIIIHRPFIDKNDSLDSGQQKRNYKKIEKIVKDYLSEVNVETRLYDDMFRIDSDNGKLLSKDELVSYGLYGDDPFYKEANEARRAKELGITKSELYRREGRKDILCTPYWSQCQQAAINPGMDDESKDKACAPYAECEDEVLNGRR